MRCDHKTCDFIAFGRRRQLAGFHGRPQAICEGLLQLFEYFDDTRALISRTLRNDSLPPLQRLRAYLDATAKFLDRKGLENGCLIGNFSVEASDHSEIIRQRIVEIFEELQRSVAYCLRAAVKAGELSPATECDELAGFVVASQQGAILRSKAERSSTAIERFKRIVFSTLLRDQVVFTPKRAALSQRSVKASQSS